MKFLKNSIKALAFMLPCVFVFYIGYNIVDSKSPISHFNQTFSIVLGTLLMAIGICAIYFLLKNDFFKSDKENEKSNFYYLDENNNKMSRLV